MRVWPRYGRQDPARSRGGRHRRLLPAVAAVLGAAALTLVATPAPAAQAAPPPAGPAHARPDVVPVCGTPKPGQFGCFALRRTDVPAVKGLTTAADVPAGYGAGDLEDAYSLPADGGAGQTVHGIPVSFTVSRER